ncbi:S41 family peptidase [Tenuifilum thalassicum]|uniref:S41 family peptidase n=1 Tax=Tenuifilum thalassicum TaxID=2590900 RepID=A0A7D3XNQ2_9BACT|nr:S41 family peptidase [Tenuifilum thalassicum]QKG81076.1 S41 family peptidase [Tenuifilum thalassicum]
MRYSNSKRDIIYPIVIAVVLVVGVLVGLMIGGKVDKPNLLVYPRTDKLTNVIRYISEEYVDTVSVETLVEEAIPAILKNLDPHSVYIPADQLQTVNEPLEGGFDGIGIQFNMNNDTVVVVNTIPGGPSEKLGILAGDRIVRVDGRNIAGVKFPMDSVPKLLKGPTGTKVTVSIKRAGVDELIDFEIVRDKIPIYSVDVSYMPTPDIGYIKINTFAKTTYKEFLEAMIKLSEKGMKRLVLDLRSNSGGYMDAAINIANEFLKKGNLIVYTKGKNRPREEAISNGKGLFQDLPLTVLIDEFSASASEILAGAIQDNDRGLIIGRRSFGKGLVQEQVYFSDGSALRLTIARYYTPSGRSIQKPYKPGDDEYFYEIGNRYLHGEFQNADSIQFADSLKYFTAGGRVVYGGGGIMPDIFVPLDTAGITPYYQQVSRRNLIYRFAFSFADKHRANSRNFKTFEDVDGYLKKFNLIKDFVRFAKDNGVDPIQKDIERSKLIIETQLKATIARNFIDNSGFYPYIRYIDETLLKAIEVCEKTSCDPLTLELPLR